MIGDLYDSNNVVVGQAATFFAAKNTALPAFNTWNQADPFDPAFFLSFSIVDGSATSYTLTYVLDGKTATTTSITVAGNTTAAIKAALEALSTVGVGNVTVTGSAGTWKAVFKGDAIGGTLSMTPTGGSGASVTNPLWTPCGATDQGWQFGASKSTQTIGIEEQSTPVAVTLTSQSVSLAGALSEDITRTLNLALNATSATTAAATGVAGYDKVSLSDTPLEYAVACVMQNPEGFGRIVYAPAWTQLANAQVNFRRAADKRNYGVQFETVCATKDIAIYNFTVAGL